MADKIVTLQDKDGNKVFPVSGGVNTDTITTSMLQDNAVTTAKINDLSVTSDKIAGNAVTTSKILNGAVTGNKLGLTLEDIPCDFYRANVYTYAVTGKLLKLGNIGILMYTGTTGFTVGPGSEQIQFRFSSAGFTDILGGSLVYSQDSNPSCTMKFVRFFNSLVDAYVETSNNGNFDASVIIIGVLGDE